MTLDTTPDTTLDSTPGTHRGNARAVARRRPILRDATDRLRRVLTVNGVFSAGSGVTMVVAAEAVADLLGTGHPGWIRVVGIGLAVFGLGLVVLARSEPTVLRRVTPLVCAADAAWVVGSLVTIVLGWYSAGGIIAVLIIAAVVDAFAVLQFRGWRKTTR